MVAKPARQKIAIIGSGCSGLAAAWALKDSDKEIHIFEKSAKLGGHTNTQTWRHNGESVPVDTGFIVLNTATYPNFIRFLKEVGIEPVETEMTFSVSRDQGKFEWSGEARGIFAQRRNLFRPQHWRLIFDIIRFNQFALDLISEEECDGRARLGSSRSHRKMSREMSIGEYLRQHGYSSSFRDDYLIPMTAAVWSTSPDKATLEFPAKTLIRFMWNHHLLTTLAVRPPWLTIDGGAQRYIDAIVKSFPSGRLHLHTSCAVDNILRSRSGDASNVIVSWTDQTTAQVVSESFSHAILACHGDEILPILSPSQVDIGQGPGKSVTAATHRGYDDELSPIEREVFSSFETTENICYLHADLSLMPTRRATWTSWNYLTSTKTKSSTGGGTAVSLTYNMNILQHIPVEKFGHVLVTMNPECPPDPALTQGRFVYRHPLFTSTSVQAQKQLRAIQNQRGVSYCGAWTNYGFHEDGFSSGLRVATEHLDAKLPFDFIDSTFSRGHKPILGFGDYALRILLLLILAMINVVHFVLQIPGVSLLVGIVSSMSVAALDLAEASGLL